ncbi:carbonic anhydrase 14 [Ornithorhynchus anatinus]|uniref:carbonic anhydrase n=1 Tax=Ornithorhynchus anatinus TaxID=9258 RepID=A0A6I8PH11_ORNAN|nr:carbonic anhydrase 14 [Ornithorhynchus anatinus]
MFLLVASLLQLVQIAAAARDSHWTYEGPHGQDHWPASYPDCGGGSQSPIDIRTDGVVFDPALAPLQPEGYDRPGPEPLVLKNNGHTVQLSLPSTLRLGGLPVTYAAAQLHLHWGQPGQPGGAEHRIDGRASAAELHVVHYDSDTYGSLQEAAPQPLGLAVLGVLIEVGDGDNEAYEHILSHLQEIRRRGEETEVEPFDVSGLLPPDLGAYYRYNGSLTTPPCYQSVLWTLTRHPVQLSPGQLERLQLVLFSTGDEDPGPPLPLVHNFRDPQPLNSRRVTASFPDEGSYSIGKRAALGLGVLAGAGALVVALLFVVGKIRRKRREDPKSVVFTSSRRTNA